MSSGVMCRKHINSLLLTDSECGYRVSAQHVNKGFVCLFTFDSIGLLCLTTNTTFFFHPFFFYDCFLSLLVNRVKSVSILAFSGWK